MISSSLGITDNFSNDSGVFGASIGFKAMSTPCEIKVFGKSKEILRNALNQAVKEIQRIELKYSRFNSESVLSKINQGACHNSIQVDLETGALFDFSEHCFELSGGAFCVTSGALAKFWSTRSENQTPSDAELLTVLNTVGWDKVNWESPFISFNKPDVMIDFGGIGKEYAADRAANTIRSHGIMSGLVNLGGDISVIGPKPDGKDWLIGIQGRDGKVVSYVPIKKGGLATSGHSQRFYTIGGIKYSHIINASNGRPCTGHSTCTVWANSCLEAGALSTIGLLLGKKASGFFKKNCIDAFFS